MKQKLLLLGMLLIIIGSLTNCKKYGCTKQDAENYDFRARRNDGRCEYARVNFMITNIVQSYYPNIDQYGLIHIYYEIENTGDFDVNYYEIWFEMISEGHVFRKWEKGEGIKIGKKANDYIQMNTLGKKYNNVFIESYYLDY